MTCGWEIMFGMMFFILSSWKMMKSYQARASYRFIGRHGTFLFVQVDMDWAAWIQRNIVKTNYFLAIAIAWRLKMTFILWVKVWDNRRVTKIKQVFSRLYDVNMSALIRSSDFISLLIWILHLMWLYMILSCTLGCYVRDVTHGRILFQ